MVSHGHRRFREGLGLRCSHCFFIQELDWGARLPRAILVSRNCLVACSGAMGCVQLLRQNKQAADTMSDVTISSSSDGGLAGDVAGDAAGSASVSMVMGYVKSGRGSA